MQNIFEVEQTFMFEIEFSDTTLSILLISKHSCRPPHACTKNIGNCNKRDCQNLNSFSSWYKVHNKHLHTCIKIIMCKKKRTNWFSINLQKYLPTEI